MLVIKKLKIAEHLSEETIAFSCELWFEKVKVAYASCKGHGDGVCITPSQPLFREIEKAWKGSGTIEDWVEDYVDKEYAQKQIKSALSGLARLCKKNMVIVNKEAFEAFKNGKSTQIASASVKVDYGTLSEEMRIKYKKKFLKEGEIVLNESF